MPRAYDRPSICSEPLCRKPHSSRGFCQRHRLAALKEGKIVRLTPEARFWERVNKDGPTVRAELGPCWLWTGYITSDGYGATALKRRPLSAHRLSWRFSNGDPGAAWVLHSCDTRACVRPSHLFLGSPADNSADMVAKGRSAKLPCHGAKLTEADVRGIRVEHSAGCTQVSLAAKYGVHRAAIGLLLKGITWRHVA